MSIIKQLSLHEAHKIAAGEVVERPANIVKELIENSLDAGATHITLYIEDGGKQLIRVVDNGCGMDEPDARACFNKHATSKITHVDELETINTFGFRGEALASVAAVARITLITKQADTLEGIKVSVACSAITNTQPISATTGTDISVYDLFYTIPARKKFLKKQETEWRHIVQLFHAFCLSFPHIHFNLYNEGANIHTCPPVKNISDRFAQLWHNHHLLPIANERIDGTVSISGAISTNNHYRYDRNALFFFVNNRWIKNFALAQALIKGYHGLLPAGKYPIGCILITIDPTLIDINIHPRKEEVAFMYPQKVTHLITSSVQHALEKQTSTRIPTAPQTDITHIPFKASATQFEQTQPSVFTPFNFESFLDAEKNILSENTPLDSTPNTHHRPLPIPPIAQHTQATTPHTNITHTNTLNPQIEQNNFQETDTYVVAQQHKPQTLYAPTEIAHNTHPTQSAQNTHLQIDTNTQIYNQNTVTEENSFTIIGQLHHTYILVEHADGLVLFDQHAAHERILYELFSTRFADCATINLLFPTIIMLSRNDYATIEPHLTLFKQNGIFVEPFGNNQLVISSTPVHLKDINFEELIKQVIGWIHEYGAVDHTDFFKTINEKLHAQCACKAAVKAGDTLSHEQMHNILTDLHKTANRFTCPHGRPTSFLLSLDEIEKRIKRKK